MVNRFVYGICWVGLLVLWAGKPLFAQNATVSRFTAASLEEKVLLDWVIAAGATCDGIGIYRGNDTVGMTLIHHIPGVCGDLARPVTYTYIDSFPLANRKNYYRLELGPRVFTPPISISLVDLGGQTYQFRPHPVGEQANLYLSGDVFLSYTLQLFDSQGKLRLSTQFQGNSVSLSTGELENGLYLFTLSGQNGGLLRRGKMLVQR